MVPPAVSFAVSADMIAMKSATPAAPPTWLNEPSMALPCEYSCGGTDAKHTVNSGVNNSAKPTLMTMWPAKMYSQRLCVPSSVIAQSTAVTMMTPGITSFAGPARS